MIARCFGTKKRERLIDQKGRIITKAVQTAGWYEQCWQIAEQLYSSGAYRWAYIYMPQASWV